MLLRGCVFKDTSGVCFLATGLIQSTLAVSEHPTMPTSTVENTIKICRVLEKSLSIAPPVGRETRSLEQMQEPLVWIGELRRRKVPTQGHQATFRQATSFQAHWPQEGGSVAGGQTIVTCCLRTGGRELFKWPFP